MHLMALLSRLLRQQRLHHRQVQFQEQLRAVTMRPKVLLKKTQRGRMC